MMLSKRLRYIVSRVDKCSTVADIGTDHGKIPYALLSLDLADEVIATDISAPSLLKAENLLHTGNFDGRYRCVEGDGLRPLVGENIDIAIIAGMGGMEIISILDERDRGVASRYILSPHRDSESLRRYLISHGYRITKDTTIADGGKYYDVIEAEVGEDSLSEDEYKFGRDNLIDRGEDFIQYLEVSLSTYEGLLGVVNATRKCQLDIEIDTLRRILYVEK